MFASTYASGGSQSFKVTKDQFKYFVFERQNKKEVAYGKYFFIKLFWPVNFARFFTWNPWNILCFVLQMEELYVEILYTILHMIGCDAEKTETNALVEHLKDAFHMEDEKHQKLLDIATMREEPYLKANVEIFEARGLLGKDMLGSSDPYCTFYLTTNPLTRYNTSYKPKTLDPTWNEDFVL